MDWEPEVGQMLFSNTPMAQHKLPDCGTSALIMLGEAIAELRDDEVLTVNYGSPPFENDVFAMRTYCWCDGQAPGHENGCPPNFEYKPLGLRVFWYKHAGRSASTTQVLTDIDWNEILMDCLKSLESETQKIKESL